MTTWKDTSVRCPFAPGMVEVDLVDPDLYGSGDPHAIWAMHRRIAPVRWHPVGTDRGFWSVTRYADASRVLREYETFSSQRGTLLNLLGTGDPAGGSQMAATDPPRHGELREPLQRALSIQAVEHYRDDIRALVAELLAPLADRGPFDLAAAMSSLPMAVTGTMMAIPREDWPLLTRAATAALAADDPAYQIPGGPAATLRRAHREIFAYFQDIVACRRKNAGDDLLGTLLGIQMNGRALTDGQIAANCYSLLVGATLTTPQVVSSAVAHLAGTNELDRWAADPDLMHTGVEEAIRWASPTTHFMRYSLHDIDLAGEPIRAGDAVVVWLGSANRDELIFNGPFRFDIARKPNKHIAFGVGPHYCIGHTIARVILRAAFAELLGRFTEVELASDPVRLRSNIIAGFRELRITGRPRPTPAPILGGSDRRRIRTSRQANAGGMRAFKSWYEEAGVRSGPRRVCGEDLDKKFFPDHLVPHLGHPLVRDAPDPLRRYLSAQHLYQWLNFTAKFEIAVVVRATQRIADGRIALPLTRELRRDAMRICVDENYHALYSVDVVDLIEDNTGVSAIPYDFMPFLSHLDGIADAYPEHRELVQLLQVVVFETLITSLIEDVPKDLEVMSVVRETVRDHAEDERRHHAFFAQFFKELWAWLEQSDREIASQLLPDVIIRSLQPATRSAQAALGAVGFPKAQIDQIIAESYDHPFVMAGIVVASTKTVALLERCGVLDLPGAREGFQNAGFTTVR